MHARNDYLVYANIDQGLKDTIRWGSWYQEEEEKDLLRNQEDLLRHKYHKQIG